MVGGVVLAAVLLVLNSPDGYLGSGVLARIFYRLMSFAGDRRDLLVMGTLFSVGVTLAGIAIPWLVKVAIDRAFPPDGPRQPDLLWPLALGILGLALLRFLFGFGRRYATNYLGHVVEYRLREALFRKMLDLHHGFYDRSSTGELVSRATNDLRVVRFFVGWGCSRCLSACSRSWWSRRRCCT
jgi:ATP-binding cassette subfamily B protein